MRRRSLERQPCCARLMMPMSSGPPACGAQPPGNLRFDAHAEKGSGRAWEAACPAAPCLQLRMLPGVQLVGQALLFWLER